jgi:hypothetical protein
MAFSASSQFGLAGISSIVSEIVTILATHARFFLVDDVVIIDGLVLSRKKKLWEYNPTNKQCTSEAYYKEKPAEQTRILLLVFSGHGTPQ